MRRDTTNSGCALPPGKHLGGFFVISLPDLHSASSMIHRKITVKGKVQGVYFRATARSVAVNLGLRGAVKNLPDGNVWIVAEGPEAAMQEFIDWCRIGPTGASVASLDIEEGAPVHYEGFEILHE